MLSSCMVLVNVFIDAAKKRIIIDNTNFLTFKSRITYPSNTGKDCQASQPTATIKSPITYPSNTGRDCQASQPTATFKSMPTYLSNTGRDCQARQPTATIVSIIS